ncbi:MAG TPA: hypothetical protein ENI11_00570 [Actinobacteria bacterium]|nr:hypothetical protein [Actinomycetota bacterium]
MEGHDQQLNPSPGKTLEKEFHNSIFRPTQTVRSKNIGAEHAVKPIALVVWEDITAYTRIEIPDDFDVLRLTKITVGILWKESEDYLVLVQDYDLSNRGKGYKHNDFHIIPRGTVKEVRILGQIEL